MKTPEEIALIGGGILLSSGLVFGLKSGTASTLPNVSHSLTSISQNIDSTRKSADFGDEFKQAQQKGWQTGQWGSAKFYVDDQQNMHVGSGQLSGSYSKVVTPKQISTITLDKSIQAPQDSSNLFADYAAGQDGGNNLKSINNLNKLDTSQTTNMANMFYGDSSLNNLDVSHFDTHNVVNRGMVSMFEGDSSLTGLDVSNFNTSNVENMYGMFDGDSSLSNLDVSHFNPSYIIDTDSMFANDNSLKSLDLSSFNTHWDMNMWSMLQNDGSLSYLKLGTDTNLNNNIELTGTYQNNGQTLNLDWNAHPGTWYKQ